MTRFSLQPMDSLQMQGFVAPANCFVCSVDNTHEAEYCRHCRAPMSLAHQAKAQKSRPKLIVTLGSNGSGKTSYLGMLIDILSRQNDRAQILARGAFSISMQQETVGSLRSCVFPQATSMPADEWNWLHCQYTPKSRRRPVEIVMPDVCGETLSQGVDDGDEFPVVPSLANQSDGAMIFVDTDAVESGEHDQDFFAMKMINYLWQENNDRKRGWPSRPVAIIFTKSDRSPMCQADPATYTQRRLPSLWKLCEERLKRFAFFSTSVTAATAFYWEYGSKVHVPLRIEPRGITQPFEWLVDGLPK